MHCNFCGSDKHTDKNCTETWQGRENRRKLSCSFCWKNGHTVKACPETWQGLSARRDNPEKVSDEFVEDHDLG